MCKEVSWSAEIISIKVLILKKSERNSENSKSM